MYRVYDTRLRCPARLCHLSAKRAASQSFSRRPPLFLLRVWHARCHALQPCVELVTLRLRDESRRARVHFFGLC